MKIQKAVEISDAKIQFVSLVDKAANKRQFLITKAQDGTAQFSTIGKILKVDDSSHYITGIVYEPLIEDAHGNFMTEEEIKKAAYWFAKNGDKVDLQHSFEAVDGINVVENYIAPCDMEIESTPVIKGTWVMTVEVSNTDVWESVQKGEITGFSMGGIGKYSDKDVDLEGISKSEQAPSSVPEKKSLFKKMAELFGYDVVEKGAMTDLYRARQKSSGFWNAIDTLSELLCRGHWDYATDRYVYDFEENEANIRTALEEFSTIVADVLTEGSIAKMLAVAAPANPVLKTITKKEEIDMTKPETLALIEETVKKSLEAAGIVAKATDPTPPTPAPAASSEPEALDATVEKAVKKALIECGLIEDEPDEDEPVTKATLEEIVTETVNKALEPLLRARGASTNLNDSTASVQKNEPHYLTGIL